MNRKLFSFLTICFVFLILSAQAAAQKKPRIGVAGIRIESSTFSPALTAEDAFQKRLGQEVMNFFPCLQPGSPLLERAVWLPAMTANATPGGALSRETYESLVGQILERVKANLPYDALFLDIHGAMSVVGLDDPEGDFMLRLREVVGKEPLISTCMDLHGNVSIRLAKSTDLITCYRLAPHEDAMESRERAVVNLLERLENGKGRPAYKAWIPVPVLLAGEQTSTRVEPAKSLYGAIAPLTAAEGIIDAAIWIGYAWADEPRNHAVVMVTGDDRDMVVSAAEYLARHFWSVRHRFEFVAPVGSLKECLDKAIASDKRPFFISDTGDNPTAGGAGDVTWTLTELLKRPEFQTSDGPSLIYASIPGAELVKKAKRVGVGNRVEGNVGAEVDNRYSPPLKLAGKVTAIYEHPDNSEVVVKVGSVSVIVTEKRKPFHYEKEFTKLGLNPRGTDIVMVKIGYLVPELYDMQSGWLMALTLGGVNQNLVELPYKRINRPMYPLDKDLPTPDLSARLIE